MASIIYVGPDEYYTNITDAMVGVNQGDTIYVYDGTYSGTSTWTSTIREITLQGESREGVIIEKLKLRGSSSYPDLFPKIYDLSVKKIDFEWYNIYQFDFNRITIDGESGSAFLKIFEKNPSVNNVTTTSFLRDIEIKNSEGEETLLKIYRLPCKLGIYNSSFKDNSIEYEIIDLRKTRSIYLEDVEITGTTQYGSGLNNSTLFYLEGREGLNYSNNEPYIEMYRCDFSHNWEDVTEQHRAASAISVIEGGNYPRMEMEECTVSYNHVQGGLVCHVSRITYDGRNPGSMPPSFSNALLYIERTMFFRNEIYGGSNYANQRGLLITTDWVDDAAGGWYAPFVLFQCNIIYNKLHATEEHKYCLAFPRRGEWDPHYSKSRIMNTLFSQNYCPEYPTHASRGLHHEDSGGAYHGTDDSGNPTGYVGGMYFYNQKGFIAGGLYDVPDDWSGQGWTYVGVEDKIKFIDSINNDFRIQSGSFLIDRGMTDPTLDHIDPDGSDLDIGRFWLGQYVSINRFDISGGFEDNFYEGLPIVINIEVSGGGEWTGTLDTGDEDTYSFTNSPAEITHYFNPGTYILTVTATPFYDPDFAVTSTEEITISAIVGPSINFDEIYVENIEGNNITITPTVSSGTFDIDRVEYQITEYMDGGQGTHINEGSTYIISKTSAPYSHQILNSDYPEGVSMSITATIYDNTTLNDFDYRENLVQIQYNTPQIYEVDYGKNGDIAQKVLKMDEVLKVQWSSVYVVENVTINLYGKILGSDTYSLIEILGSNITDGGYQSENTFTKDLSTIDFAENLYVDCYLEIIDNYTNTSFIFSDITIDILRPFDLSISCTPSIDEIDDLHRLTVTTLNLPSSKAEVELVAKGQDNLGNWSETVIWKIEGGINTNEGEIGLPPVNPYSDIGQAGFTDPACIDTLPTNEFYWRLSDSVFSSYSDFGNSYITYSDSLTLDYPHYILLTLPQPQEGSINYGETCLISWYGYGGDTNMIITFYMLKPPYTDDDMVSFPVVEGLESSFILSVPDLTQKGWSEYETDVMFVIEKGQLNDNVYGFTCRSTPQLDLTYPIGGETLSAQQTISITWTETNVPNLHIQLYKEGVYYPLEGSTPNIADNIAGSLGIYNWTLPPISTLPEDTNYQIHIVSLEDMNYSHISNYFTIIDNFYLTIYSPNEDSIWYTGENNKTIGWGAIDENPSLNFGDCLHITLLSDLANERVEEVIAYKTPLISGPGLYSWDLPELIDTTHEGLTGYWKLDYENGLQVWDSGPYQRHGTMYTSTQDTLAYDSGYFGQSLYFRTYSEGTTPRVKLTNDIYEEQLSDTLGGDFTVSAWVYFEPFSEDHAWCEEGQPGHYINGGRIAVSRYQYYTNASIGWYLGSNWYSVGSEKLTNHSWDDGETGWTWGGGWTYSSSSAVNSTTAGTLQHTTGVTCEEDKFYRLYYEVLANEGNCNLQLATYGGNELFEGGVIPSTVGSHYQVLKCKTTGGQLGFYTNMAGDTIQLDWISVRELIDHPFYFSINDKDGNINSVSKTNFFIGEVNTWHHFTGVFEAGKSLKLYMDGELVDSDTIDIISHVVLGNYHTGGERLPVYIGSRSNGSSNWNGYIDDVRIYNKVKTKGEVNEIMNSPALVYNENEDYYVKLLDTTSGMQTTSDPFKLKPLQVKIWSQLEDFKWYMDENKVIWHYSYGAPVGSLILQLYKGDDWVYTFTDDIQNTEDGVKYLNNLSLPSGLEDDTNYRLYLFIDPLSLPDNYNNYSPRDDSDLDLVYDFSDYFELATKPTFEFLWPFDPVNDDNLFAWYFNQTIDIFWGSTASSGYVDLYLCERVDEEINLYTVAESVADVGSYTWTIPSSFNTFSPTDKVRLIITDAAEPFLNPFVSHDSSKGFYIYDSPEISLINPDSIMIGSIININGSSSDYGNIGTSGTLEVVRAGITDRYLDLEVPTPEGEYIWSLESSDNYVQDSTYQLKFIPELPIQNMVYYENMEVAALSDPFFIVDPPSLQVITPVANTIVLGLSVGINWINNLPWSGESTVKIDLYQAGESLQQIIASTSNDGFYFWSSPTDLEEDNNYQIKISEIGSSVSDIGGNFSIIETVIEDLLDITDTFESSYNYHEIIEIYWSSLGVGSIKLELYLGTEVMDTICPACLAQVGHYTYSVPGSLTESSNYHIKISDHNSALYDTTNLFRIQVPPEIDVTNPTESAVYFEGDTVSIEWSSINISNSVEINYYYDSSYIYSISDFTSNDGEYIWTIPPNLFRDMLFSFDREDSFPTPEDLRIMESMVQVKDIENTIIYGLSDSFWIYPYPHLVFLYPSLTTLPSGYILQPEFYKGKEIKISWEGINYREPRDLSTQIDLKLYKGGIYQSTLVSEYYSSLGEYIWEVPSITTGEDYTLKLQFSNGDGDISESDPFKIMDEPSINLLYPDGATSFKLGDTLYINWENLGDYNDVFIGELTLANITVDTLFYNILETEKIITVDLGENFPSSENYKIKITRQYDLNYTDVDPQHYGFSPSFTIRRDPVIQFVQPPFIGFDSLYLSHNYLLSWRTWDLFPEDQLRLDLYQGGTELENYLFNIHEGFTPDFLEINNDNIETRGFDTHPESDTLFSSNLRRGNWSWAAGVNPHTGDTVSADSGFRVMLGPYLGGEILADTEFDGETESGNYWQYMTGWNVNIPIGCSEARFKDNHTYRTLYQVNVYDFSSLPDNTRFRLSYTVSYFGGDPLEAFSISPGSGFYEQNLPYTEGLQVVDIYTRGSGSTFRIGAECQTDLYSTLHIDNMSLRRVMNEETAIDDSFSEPFGLIDPAIYNIVTPMEGDTIYYGGTASIEWWSTGAPNYVKLSLFRDDGLDWVIETGVDNENLVENSYVWDIDNTWENTDIIETYLENYERDNRNPIFRIQVSDIFDNTSWGLSDTFSIDFPRAIDIISPDSEGLVFIEGETEILEWRSWYVGNYVDIEIYGELDGTSYKLSDFGTQDNDDEFNFSVPSPYAISEESYLQDSSFKFVMTSIAYPGISDTSIPFHIIERPVLHLLYPNGGEDLRFNFIHRIYWESNSTVSNHIQIGLFKGGNLVQYITKDTPNTGSFDWVPLGEELNSGSDYHIQITDNYPLYGIVAIDSSDNHFELSEDGTTGEGKFVEKIKDGIKGK